MKQETILDQILQEKRKEVDRLKMKEMKPTYENQLKKSLFNTLKQSNTLSVIAEIKRASPSNGDINVKMDPVEQAILYEKSGASAISVLTDTPFFKGSFNDLMHVRQAVNIPILCKDFIINEIQIDLAKMSGADIVLLIASALPKPRLQELYKYAEQLELDVLLEVHDEDELQIALDIGANIIGINNRNLKTFEVDLHLFERLVKQLRAKDIVLISESGIHNKEDALFVSNNGADAILVGESLMKTDDVPSLIESFRIPRVAHFS